MSYIDNYEAAPEADPLTTLLGERYDEALGVAADAAADVRADYDKKGALYHYIEECRFEAIAALTTLADIDAGDVAGVRKIQLALHTYRSVVGFAQRLLDGYSQPESDSADD